MARSVAEIRRSIDSWRVVIRNWRSEGKHELANDRESRLYKLDDELAEAERREAKEERILDLVDRWHEGDGEGRELHEYLGMTQAEYAAWLERRASYIGAVAEAERREVGNG